MKISIVCPFFNEETVIKSSVNNILIELNNLKLNYELIFVNDGSNDKSLEVIEKFTYHNNDIKLISYKNNKGRGYALKRGLNLASGELIITTEIDLSWGKDIFKKFVNKYQEDTDVDIIIASPHTKNGGYENVPINRIYLSKFGNIILRFAYDSDITMYTGMTRAYRKGVFDSLPIDSNGKEFHLEVLQKAISFGLIIKEIPAVINWNIIKQKTKRKSSSKISSLIKSHLLFAAILSVVKYIFIINFIFVLIFLTYLCLAFYNFIFGGPSVFYLIISLIFFLLSEQLLDKIKLF